MAGFGGQSSFHTTSCVSRWSGTWRLSMLTICLYIPNRNVTNILPDSSAWVQEIKPRKRKFGASIMAQMVKNLPATQDARVWSLGGEDPLEKGMATHSSILAWRIPWTEEPAGLQTIGPQRVIHTHTHTHTESLLVDSLRSWKFLVSHTCPASSWPAQSSSHGFWVPKAAGQGKPRGQALFKLLPMSYSTVTH